MKNRRRGAVLGLFVAGVAALAAWAFLGDPAEPIGPPTTATIMDVDTRARDWKDPVGRAPSVAWTAETVEGRRVVGRSLAEAVPEEGTVVCVQRYRRETTGEPAAVIVDAGACS
ncbi:MAG: hypothetical protein ACFBWO_05895 [Paracoccaceae bacterium]